MGEKIFEKFDFHQRLAPRIYKELQLNYKSEVILKKKQCLCIILLSIAVPKHHHQK